MGRKLILIDGITRSGKSTTAQYLAFQYRMNGHDASWYRENDAEHPLIYRDEDIEELHDPAKVRVYCDAFLDMLQAFADRIKDSGSVHIVENHYLQNTVWIMLQNDFQFDEIAEFFNRINNTIALLETTVLYFHRQNVSAAIRRI